MKNTMSVLSVLALLVSTLSFPPASYAAGIGGKPETIKVGPLKPICTPKSPKCGGDVKLPPRPKPKPPPAPK